MEQAAAAAGWGVEGRGHAADGIGDGFLNKEQGGGQHQLAIAMEPEGPGGEEVAQLLSGEVTGQQTGHGRGVRREMLRGAAGEGAWREDTAAGAVE
ncbi:MAG: hypothetical protein ACK56I_33510, partial [bacterium]